MTYLEWERLGEVTLCFWIWTDNVLGVVFPNIFINVIEHLL